MHFLQRLKVTNLVLRAIQRQEINFVIPRGQVDKNFICRVINRTLTRSDVINEKYSTPLALRNKKAKSTSHTYNYFVDIKQVMKN